jgi:hypothetical protein
MADLPAPAHARILSTIRDAMADVVVLRQATAVKTGYQGFELAETTLASCYAAISDERDQARVIVMLKKAAGALALVGGGDVAPAVERTRKTLKAILQELEPEAQENG